MGTAYKAFIVLITVSALFLGLDWLTSVALIGLATIANLVTSMLQPSEESFYGRIRKSVGDCTEIVKRISFRKKDC